MPVWVFTLHFSFDKLMTILIYQMLYLYFSVSMILHGIVHVLLASSDGGDIKYSSQYILPTIALILIIALTGSIIKQNMTRAAHSLEQKKLSAEISVLQSNYLEAESKAVKAQLNPHFMFNILTSAQGYVLSNDAGIAANHIGKLAILMRKVLEQSRFKSHSLKQEVEFLKQYLTLVSDRLGKEFSYTFEISSELDDETIGLPPMLIQPLVENSIIHGLFHKKGSRLLVVSFDVDKASGTLYVTVEDNGVGRGNGTKTSVSKNDQIKEQSFGLGAVRKYLQCLEGSETNKCQLSIEDLFDDSDKPSGTKIHIEIPYKEIKITSSPTKLVTHK